MDGRCRFLMICFFFLESILGLFSAEAASQKDNPVPKGIMVKLFDLHGRKAVFVIKNHPRSLVGVRLDGVKLVVRSLEGNSPIRIVIDHLPPGWHRVTFRFAHPDQYEFGDEKVFRIRVLSKESSEMPENGVDRMGKRQGTDN